LKIKKKHFIKKDGLSSTPKPWNKNKVASVWDAIEDFPQMRHFDSLVIMLSLIGMVPFKTKIYLLDDSHEIGNPNGQFL